jgi:hypothetical protein
MRGGEGIVHIDIAKRRHALGEFDVVLFFARMKAGVLEHQHAARRGAIDRLLRLGDVSPVSGDEADRVSGCVGNGRHHDLERKLGVHLAFGPAEMGEQDSLAIHFDDLADRGDDALDAGGVGDLAVGDGHVQVDTQEDILALEIKVVEGLETGAHREVLPRGVCAS